MPYIALISALVSCLSLGFQRVTIPLLLLKESDRIMYLESSKDGDYKVIFGKSCKPLQ